jgi:hypothetical protein
VCNSGARAGDDAPPPAFGEHGNHVDRLCGLRVIRTFPVGHQDSRRAATTAATISALTVVPAMTTHVVAECLVDALFSRATVFFDIGCPFDLAANCWRCGVYTRFSGSEASIIVPPHDLWILRAKYPENAGEMLTGGLRA